MSVGANPTTVDLTAAQEKFEKVKKQVCVCGNGLELRPTEFGLGLFATKFFAKGDAITLYGGQLIDIKTAKKRLEENQDSHIRRHIVRRYCFDGSFLPDGTRIENAAVQLVGLPVGAFCNDSSDEKQINALEIAKLVEAAIVRIMKSRKRLQHPELFAEASRQLANAFPLHIDLFKRCVETLIDREYVKRDDAATSYFEYVA